MLDKRKLRRLLQTGENEFITIALASETLQLNTDDANEAIQKLEDSGYIEKIGIENCWGVGLRGKVLAHQTFERIFKVGSLNEHLNSFKERVALINSSQNFPHTISRIKITSEYPIQNRSNGIHIVYSLTMKEMSMEKYDELSYKLRTQSSKGFYNLIDIMFYPEVRIHEILKSRSHILKLKKVKEDEIDNIKGHLLFDSANAK